MKRILLTAVILGFLGTMVLAANAASIGHIDVQRVFREYKATSKAQEELSKQEESFRKEFEESQKKLEKLTTEGKPTTEVEKVRKELEEKLTPKRETLLKLNEQLTTKLQLEIIDSVKSVAKRVGIDLVLDKQVIITGGIDLTELVINELNK